MRQSSDQKYQSIHGGITWDCSARDTKLIQHDHQHESIEA